MYVFVFVFVLQELTLSEDAQSDDEEGRLDDDETESKMPRLNYYEAGLDLSLSKGCLFTEHLHFTLFSFQSNLCRINKKYNNQQQKILKE